MIKRGSIFFILLVLSNALSAQNWPDSLKAGIEKSFDLYDEEKDIEAINSLISLIGNAEMALGKQDLDIANAWHNLGVLYYRLFQYDLAIENYSKALEIRKKKLEPNDVELIKGYHNIGAAYQYKGDFENAVEFLSGAISRNGNPAVSENRLIRSYREIARAYSKMGENAKALEFYDFILAHYLESGDYRALASTYNDMAGLFTRQDDGEKSREMSEKALDFFEKIEPKSNRDYRSLGGIYHNYAIGFEIKEDFDNALNAYGKSLDLNKEYAGEKSQLVALNHNNIGLVYLKMKHFKKAVEHFEKAISLNSALYDPAALADNYHNMGDLNFRQGNYVNALEAYDQALSFLTGNEDRPSANSLADYASAGDKLGLLANLSSKAICHYRQYLAVKNGDNLDEALTTFQLTDELVDQLRKDYRFDVSKSRLAETMLPVFEAAISACITKYQNTRSPAHLETAFRYAEKSKAVSLLEALTDSKAKQFAGLPPEVRQKESQLKVDIAYHEDELRIEKSYSNADQAKVKAISNKILALRQTYDELIERLEKEFQDYHKLKYDLETRSVPQVQEKLLHVGQGMIEYFVGADSLFIFYIRPKSFRVLTLEKPPFLERLVEDFRKGISGFHLSANPTDIEYERLAKLYTLRGNQLYQLLIGRLIEEGISLPYDLVIIPDGVLNYLPFEALLTETADDPLAFSDLPYVINSHNISYCYSATLLDEMTSKKVERVSSGLLAMAPEFVNGSLPPLKNNTKEVEEIMTIWAGEKRLGAKATKSAFMDMASGFRLLHLATHAKAEEESDRSFLAFSDEPGGQGDARLLLKELYNLQLNADLVVLSACETGIGELRRGEGLISLARGMSYAGATGIVTTLWQIDDAKTSTLMGHFYQNLKKGHSKSKALTQAKLAYIASNKDYEAHPFFWAAPVAIGDMSQIRIDLSPAANWLWYLGLGVVMLMGVLFIRHKL